MVPSQPTPDTQSTKIASTNTTTRTTRAKSTAPVPAGPSPVPGPVATVATKKRGVKSKANVAAPDAETDDPAEPTATVGKTAPKKSYATAAKAPAAKKTSNIATPKVVADDVDTIQHAAPTPNATPTSTLALSAKKELVSTQMLAADSDVEMVDAPAPPVGRKRVTTAKASAAKKTSTAAAPNSLANDADTTQEPIATPTPPAPIATVKKRSIKAKAAATAASADGDVEMADGTDTAAPAKVVKKRATAARVAARTTASMPALPNVVANDVDATQELVATPTPPAPVVGVAKRRSTKPKAAVVATNADVEMSDGADPTPPPVKSTTKKASRAAAVEPASALINDTTERQGSGIPLPAVQRGRGKQSAALTTDGGPSSAKRKSATPVSPPEDVSLGTPEDDSTLPANKKLKKAAKSASAPTSHRAPTRGAQQAIASDTELLKKQLADAKAALAAKEGEVRTLKKFRVAYLTGAPTPSGAKPNDGLIPRPEGKMSKSTWRLVDAMRLTKKKEQYNAIMCGVRRAMSEGGLDLEKRFSDQPNGRLTQVYQVARERFPYLNKFVGDWPAKEFIIQALRNHRKYKPQTKENDDDNDVDEDDDDGDDDDDDAGGHDQGGEDGGGVSVDEGQAADGSEEEDEAEEEGEDEAEEEGEDETEEGEAEEEG